MYRNQEKTAKNLLHFMGKEKKLQKYSVF